MASTASKFEHHLGCWYKICSQDGLTPKSSAHYEHPGPQKPMYLKHRLNLTHNFQTLPRNLPNLSLMTKD